MIESVNESSILLNPWNLGTVSFYAPAMTMPGALSVTSICPSAVRLLCPRHYNCQGIKCYLCPSVHTYVCLSVRTSHLTTSAL